MSANHYQVLGVEPRAEGAAIRSAYRALMRLHHPDRNDDPESQSRAREITAAFAVLGDPEKRAAYDAQMFRMAIGKDAWRAADRRPPAPLRRLGLACVAVALMLSVALAVRPQWSPGSISRSDPTTEPSSSSAHVEPAAQKIAPLETAAPPVPNTDDDSVAPAVQAVIPPPPAPVAVLEQPKDPTPPIAAPQVAQPALREAPPPLPVPAEEAASADSKPASDGHRAEVERLAAGFLEQSLEHADWKKQQLLLSARNRAVTSRHLCRSDEACVTEAYLRQIRDTTTIMEGRIPNP
jgi:hypothetical protein